MLDFFRMRPILVFCPLAGIALACLLPASLGVGARALIGWDGAALAFIVAMTIVMSRTDLETLKRRARALDGGRISLLIVTLAAALVSIVAIVLELASATGGDKGYGAWLIALSLGTIALSWTLTHLMFALHYADEYYTPDEGEEPGGLNFPGRESPTYGDFAHFSFIIGCAAQTADIVITSRALRRVVTAHCIAAFVFNTAIVALTINIAAGLIGGK